MKGNDRMDEIMSQLREHLKPVVDSGARGNMHHYNRAWEKIDKWFGKHAQSPPQDIAKRLLATLKVTIEAERKWIIAAQESDGSTPYGRGLISGLEHAIGYIDTMLSALEKTND